jgi:hypothetical protein
MVNGLAVWDRERHEARLELAAAAFAPDQALLGYRDTDEWRFQKARLAVIPRPRLRRHRRGLHRDVVDLAIRGQRDWAIGMFQAAVAAGPTGAVEYSGARAELKRLGHDP